MPEEIKETIEQECECKCEFCKVVKKILAIAIGTFIGFYCAMSLFFALHRPPIPPCDGFKRPPYSYNVNKKIIPQALKNIKYVIYI